MKTTYLIILGILFFTLGCNQKNTNSGIKNIEQDSLELYKAYENKNKESNKALSDFHKQNAQLQDSTLVGLSHHFYSEFMVRKNKFDSVYYYLTISDKFLKNEPIRLFQNSIKKIYLLNKAGLITQSKLELDKLNRFKDLNIPNFKKYVDIFSLPILKQDSLTLYNHKMDSILKNYTFFPKHNKFLDNYRDNIIYKHLLEQKKYQSIEQFANQKLALLEKDNRMISDLYFTNLFYIIKAKNELNKKDIITYLNRYDSIKTFGLTREKDIQYYHLKAEYYKKLKLNDSAIINYENGLEHAIKSDNLLFENYMLQELLLLDNDSQKTYLKLFIKSNDSLTNYNKYLDDFIFATNSENADLRQKQLSKTKNYSNYGYVLFILLSISVLYFLFQRSKKINAIAQQEQFYFDNKAKMFNYLLDIKNNIDLKIITKNEDIKNLIINDAIEEIKTIEALLDRSDIDLDILQNKIEILEYKTRRISHTIAESTNEILNLELLFASLKHQFEPYFKIETFIPQVFDIDTTKNNELLKVIIFIQMLLNQIKFKENLICFISIFKKDDKYILRVWLNKEYTLKNQNIIFLQDRKITYSVEKDEIGTTLLFPLDIIKI